MRTRRYNLRNVASTRPNMKPNRRALVVLARRLGEDLAENDEALDRFSS